MLSYLYYMFISYMLSYHMLSHVFLYMLSHVCHMSHVLWLVKTITRLV